MKSEAKFKKLETRKPTNIKRLIEVITKFKGMANKINRWISLKTTKNLIFIIDPLFQKLIF